MPAWSGLAVAFVLVLLNGFFVAAEFALVKVRPTRLDELARGGSRSAVRLRGMVGHLDEYLSATQLGITLASLALGWIGEPAFARLIEPLAVRAGLSEVAIESLSVTTAFITITFLHIVFGELAPKSLAILRPEGTALRVGLPMRLFYLLFYPAIRALNGVARAALRVFGLRAPSGQELAHSEEELRLIISSMRSAGGIPGERLERMERAMRLPRLLARDLMVSRTDMVVLRLDQTAEERRETVRRSGHGRYPVIEEDVDHIAGMLSLRDLYLSPREPATPAELRALLHDPLFVPESMTAERLLEELRRKRKEFAVVVDEYGGTAGVVTAQDLISSLLGESADENADGPASIAPLTGGRFALDPRLGIAELAQRFALEIPGVRASSVGGLVMELLGRIPVPGDRVSAGSIELLVEETRGPRILRLTAHARRTLPRTS